MNEISDLFQQGHIKGVNVESQGIEEVGIVEMSETASLVRDSLNIDYVYWKTLVGLIMPLPSIS